jgi:hypothetical protein
VRALPSAFGGARWPLLIRARAGSRVRAEVGWADCFEDPATPTRQMVGGGGGDWRLERRRRGGWRVETGEGGRTVGGREAGERGRKA